jgi:uncharacterized protein YegL
MKLLNVPIDQTHKTTSGFSFSAQPLESLGSSEYTLANLAIDVSSSTDAFIDDTRKMVAAVVEALQKSPRADNLLLRVESFNSSLNELHGFTELKNVDATAYQLVASGMTALYDAAGSGLEAIGKYAEELEKFDYIANGIQFIITDGMENQSHKLRTPASIKSAADAIMRQEKLESLKTIVIGIGSEYEVRGYLDSFSKEIGADQFVWAGDATPTALAKVAGFISKSISSQSQSLGSGGASQNINF